MKVLSVKRIFGIACLVASTGAIFGQSREELRRKYSVPLSETFAVRPGMSATATYAANGTITELFISPRTTGLIKLRETTLSNESIRAVVDELVPESTRGKFLIGGFINATCLPENNCAGTSEDYQNVTIYYNAGREGGVTYAVVQWKR